MAVVVRCPGCGQFASVPQELAGQAVQCPHCQEVMAVPEDTAAAEVGSVGRATAPSTTSLKRKKPKKSPILAGVLYGGTTLLVIIGAVWLVKHPRALRPAEASGPADVRSFLPSHAATRPSAVDPTVSSPTLSKWEIGYTPRLHELRQQAEDARQAGDLTTASSKYRDLFALAAKIPVDARSPKLSSELATLESDWKAMLTQMQTRAVLSSSTSDRTSPTEAVNANSGDARTSTIPTSHDDPRPVGVEADLLPDPATAARDAHQAVAFAVDPTHLVTAAGPLGGDKSVRLEDSQGDMMSAKVIDTDAGLALLEVDRASAPKSGLSYLNLADRVTTTGVRCAAIPEANPFTPSPELLKAVIRTSPPASGEWRIALPKHPRLSGAPLINAAGDVVGVVLAGRDDPRTRLPAIPVQALRDFLSAHHALPDARCANPDPLAVFQVSLGKE